MIRKSSAFFSARVISRGAAFLLIISLSLALASSAAAQKKKKKDDTPPSPPPSVISSIPDEQKIDVAISEMLGAWQVGDTTALHKHIADDISVVNGMWAPPVVGWVNYLSAYQAQRARIQQVRLDRSNTLIRIAPSATVAWACYQWEFTAMVDGSPSAADGQTTLVLEKRADDWVIVHNHTSLVQASQPAAPANPAPQQANPAKP
jgi:ketosteroid isomerase-like protein